MSKINVLSSKIYNRIAAGEVVERPASVVKELVENSLDAGATEISVDVEKGGIASIKITDNGSGIEKDDLKKAIMPHATSKISKIEDLDDITSLGFRGEALASIASVSKLSIVSKTKKSESGARLYTEGGENVSVTEYGAADGTEITVNNLFFNTPARERFLKTEKSEEGEITGMVSRFILGHPNVSFSYTANGKQIYRSFGDGEESAFASVYGATVIKDCFYIDSEKNGIHIKGYIGKHYFTKPNRTYQSVFLNGRYVINSTVSAAILNAYSSYLMKRQYPFYSLSISMPFDAVDVNVHPNKIDVRFSNNQIVYGALYSVVSKVLDGTSEALDIITNDKNENNNEKPNELKQNYDTHNTYKGAENQDFSFNKVVFRDSGKKAGDFSEIKTEEKEHEVVDIFAENKAFLEKLERDKKEKTESFSNEFFGLSENNKTNYSQTEIPLERELKYIGQTLNTFLIFDDGTDMFFIDQHAAHERILFDKFNNQIKNGKIDTQILLLPFVFDVSPLESDFLVKNSEVIRSMGIDLEEFGDVTFKVSAVPVILSNIDLKEFFDELLADPSGFKGIELTDILKEKIAQKACKAAIKSGDKLSDEDIKYILTQIKGNLGLKCPHGRPIAVRITRTEIDKWFKRIV